MLKPTVRVGLVALLLGTTMLTAACANDPNYNRGNDTTHYVYDPLDRDWKAEDTYWRESYPERKYYRKNVRYESYRPAYRYGAAAYERYEGRDWEDINESELRSGWERFKGKSRLKWAQAKEAVRDGYERMRERADRMDGVDEYTPPHARNRY